MHRYISHSTWRREVWKGHDDEKNVRAAIRYQRANPRARLTLYVMDETGDYAEIPPSDWESTFFAN